MSEETVNSNATPEETEPKPANVSDPTPAEEETLVAPTPAAETPVVAEAPAAAPVEVETPIVAEKPVEVETPAVAEKPVAAKKSAAAEKPVAPVDPAEPRPVDVLNFGDKPDPKRGRRKLRVGRVVSNKMDKTVVVAVETRVRHPLYGKFMRRTAKFKAHDEQNCGEGDTVEIMETRPLSKEKRWRVVRIVERAK
jgi:small subunit ribosomal protein S17